jgi:hypothetical protein
VYFGKFIEVFISKYNGKNAAAEEPEETPAGGEGDALGWGF